ncbi:hypothetical protein HMPREF9136_0031 [Prevotella dentalis DSM 3688]|uniref:Uncharacterized protein n=1 Tax=Prevotella dentalis (strain ATCC 49559 / DSM 3688 / JCM 13448 / NCTC 12043 / ES 2772) TaxID=908937 RepID=F9CZK4_PREDD|nr:hypothetical protein HMPREF9136_0031 [Prevotella dentalis DSM 3688]
MLHVLELSFSYISQFHRRSGLKDFDCLAFHQLLTTVFSSVQCFISC